MSLTSLTPQQENIALGQNGKLGNILMQIEAIMFLAYALPEPKTNTSETFNKHQN